MMILMMMTAIMMMRVVGGDCSVLWQGHVVMGTQAVSVYQQVIEKTKGLSFRSQELFNSIEKRLGIKDKDAVSKGCN